ncbi:MAG: hypothetical protein L6Q97_27465, partial [Thermoanaerobaculia bacterium]|nr:hypothetical protein [Thermoanaerobaculia bacterium]
NLKVDGIFQAVSPLALSPGAHTVILFDAKGNQSAEQTIVVPERPAFTNERYETVKRKENQLYYIAKFDIQGGAPPFKLLSGGEITENNGVYTFTSPEMPDGREELAKIADANGCTAEIKYRCICPDFTLAPFCTGEQTKKATVKLIFTAGAPPFKYKLNNAATFTGLPANGELQCPPGDHTIVILDNEQVQSLPASFTVYEPISTSEPKITYTGSGIFKQSYVVEFDLFGGKPPYQADSATGTIVLAKGKAPHFISKARRCPASLTVVITDAAKCNMTRFFSPCTELPPDPRTNPGAEISLSKDVSGAALASVRTQSGATGLQYKLNDAEYRALTGPIPLSTGPNTLIFKDAQGNESEPQKFTVPASDLGMGAPAFGHAELEDGTTGRTVSFDVQG